MIHATTGIGVLDVLLLLVVLLLKMVVVVVDTDAVVVRTLFARMLVWMRLRLSEGIKMTLAGQNQNQNQRQAHKLDDEGRNGEKAQIGNQANDEELCG